MNNTVIQFKDHSTTLIVTCQSKFAACSFEVDCQNDDHRDKLAVDIIKALRKDYFEN